MQPCLLTTETLNYFSCKHPHTRVRELHSFKVRCTTNSFFVNNFARIFSSYNSVQYVPQLKRPHLWFLLWFLHTYASEPTMIFVPKGGTSYGLRLRCGGNLPLDHNDHHLIKEMLPTTGFDFSNHDGRSRREPRLTEPFRRCTPWNQPTNYPLTDFNSKVLEPRFILLSCELLVDFRNC